MQPAQIRVNLARGAPVQRARAHLLRRALQTVPVFEEAKEPALVRFRVQLWQQGAPQARWHFHVHLHPPLLHPRASGTTGISPARVVVLIEVPLDGKIFVLCALRRRNAAESMALDGVPEADPARIASFILAALVSRLDPAQHAGVGGRGLPLCDDAPPSFVVTPGLADFSIGVGGRSNNAEALVFTARDIQMHVVFAPVAGLVFNFDPVRRGNPPGQAVGVTEALYNTGTFLRRSIPYCFD